MDKPQRDARISRMEQRTLALDDIPMIGGGIRRQAFSGASREIGNDGVHRDTAAGDEDAGLATGADIRIRSEEHTYELQSLMRISYAVFCLKTKTTRGCIEETKKSQ